jgi:C-terminal processing protease CtpA/Prc
MISPVSESTGLKEKECISSNIVSSDTFSIKVHSLWCETENISSINRFENEFKVHAKKAKEYENLIIDLRGNRGGGDQETRYLLERLILSKSFLYQYQYTNASLPIYRRGLGKFASKEIDYILPAKDAIDYLGDKKITALIDSETFSSAEVVASVLKFSKSARLLGERTRGGAGDPVGELFFDGKYELIYPTCIVWQEDGSLYEQHGVTPHRKLD